MPAPNTVTRSMSSLCDQCPLRAQREVEHRFTAVKPFRIAALSPGLHASEPEQRQEGLFCEPSTVLLRLKCFDDRCHLATARGLIECDEAVRRAQVAIVLRNLVLQYEVVPVCVPREIGDQPM